MVLVSELKHIAHTGILTTKRIRFGTTVGGVVACADSSETGLEEGEGDAEP